VFSVSSIAEAGTRGHDRTSAILPPLKTVSYVDLNAYQGLWYEIVRKPVTFEEGCVGVTAEYTARADGKIDVLNQCYLETFDGPLVSGVASASVADTTTNAKLTVGAFKITTEDQRQSSNLSQRQRYFVGNYWILALYDDYTYAVVGEPSRNSLWVLSRTSTVPEETLNMILADVEAMGYDISDIIYTEQAP
jgi:apolipoprotein D and lipocalin family protein